MRFNFLLKNINFFKYFNKRISEKMTENNENKKYKRQLVFGGTGGMYNYSLGIASVIQENFKEELKDTLITGTSGGCFSALVLSLDMDVQNILKELNEPILNEVNKCKLGAFYNFNDISRKFSLEYLNKFDKNAYQKANGKLHCCMTDIPSCKPHIISDWKSNKDLINGIMASSFVPLFDKFKLTEQFRGNRYIDGYMSCPYPQPLKDVPTFIVRINMWRDYKISWFWCWSDIEWSMQLFNWGVEDANNNILEIASFFR